MDNTRESLRPFTGPASVSLAAVTLLALAVASFTAGLTRQLRLPRPDNTATVVVLTPKEAPPPAAVDAPADMTPARSAPTRVPAKVRRAPPTAPAEALLSTQDDAPATAPAPLEAADVAAIAPAAPAAAPLAEPTPPATPRSDPLNSPAAAADAWPPGSPVR